MVYVFDDEELSEPEIEANPVSDKNDLFEPNPGMRSQKIAEVRTGLLIHSSSDYKESDFPFKSTERSNNSTAELMTPKYIKSRTYLEGLNPSREKDPGNQKYYYEK